MYTKQNLKKMKKIFIILFSFILLFQPVSSFAKVPDRARCFHNSAVKIVSGLSNITSGIKKAINCIRNICEDMDMDDDQETVNNGENTENNNNNQEI